MKEKAYIIYNTEEYAAWLEGQTAKSQVQVLGRISHIQDEPRPKGRGLIWEWECLKNGDSEGVVEVIQTYLEAVNKTQIAREMELARSTMYHTLKSKNPTVKTLAKLIHACI